MANINPGQNVTKFAAAQGVLKFDVQPVTYDGSSSVASKFASTATVAPIIACKDITVTLPKSESEMVHLLGQEATTVGAGVPVTGSFQNAVYDQKATTDASMSCTLVLTGDETNIPDFIQMACGTGLDVGSYRRYTFGDATTNQKRITDGAVVLILDNGLEEVNVLLNEPFFNLGDVKPTGMDGHFEIDFEAKCLPKDCVIDIKD